MHRTKHTKKRLLKNAIQWFLVFFIAIGLAVALRVFVFAKFSIPTPSMEPAIMAGDQVIVNKLTPGSRVITNLFSLKNGEKPRFKRFAGFAVKRNDILVFNFPYSDWHRLDMDLNVFYAKRCVALPGDTFYIENGIYRVKNSPDALGNYDIQKKFSQKNETEIPPDVLRCFPKQSDYYHWTIKNFGPLYVPRKNETLLIDTLNIALYKRLIEYETKKKLNIRAGHVLLDDSVIDRYTFTRNYYFMAGDYVFDSQDSRYWGLLPEDHIVGKVAFIWNTKDRNTKKVSWNRFLKKVK